MSNKVLRIILACILVITAAFIVYTVTYHHTKTSLESNFNIKKGDIFTKDDVTLKVLNVSSSICSNKENCDLEGEVEVSVKVTYSDAVTYYTLKSSSNNKQRIDQSNYYILFDYDKTNEKLSIDIKDKNEI